MGNNCFSNSKKESDLRDGDTQGSDGTNKRTNKKGGKGDGKSIQNGTTNQ